MSVLHNYRYPFTILHHYQGAGITGVVQLIYYRVDLEIENSRQDQAAATGAD